MATKGGTVKKTSLSQYANIRRNGLIAIKLTEDDQLCWAKLCSGNDQGLLVSYDGKSIKFEEKEIRPIGRATQGVKGIKLDKDDFVVAMEIITFENQKNDFLTIMENGLGKKTPISGFPKQHRGGKGVKVAQVTKKTGKIASAQLITSACKKLILTSTKGQIVKVPIQSIPRRSRTTQGVILMRFSKKEDTLAAATCLD